MDISTDTPHYHRHERDWLETPNGDPRGYIQPASLDELWFHTGTACNLSCSFCLEGSKPGDTRLEQMTLDEVKPYIGAALDLGVRQFSFTGGEPFVNKDFVKMLDYALDFRPCLVLTNATKPLRTRLAKVMPLLEKPHRLKFRVSLDHPDPEKHDAERGAGNFLYALETMRQLNEAGFPVSLARQMDKHEDRTAVEGAYRAWLEKAGIPADVNIVAFPDFFPPGAHPEGIPHITENCMTQYHTEETRAAFMCNFSKMIVKQDGRMRIYACTLVDDDPEYDLGGNLAESMRYHIMLKHHRCFSCFAHGASCSEG